MNTDLKKKLIDAGVSEETLVALEAAGLRTEDNLRVATFEDLTACGVPIFIARSIMAEYQALAAPAVAAAPGFDMTTFLTNVQASNQGLVRSLIDAQTAQDSYVCGSCNNMLPKEYELDQCPYCSSPLNTGPQSCQLCGTEVPNIIKGAKFCVNAECSAPLWEGDDADALVFLVKNGDSIRAATEAVIGESRESGNWKRWTKGGKKVARPVLRTTHQSREEAQSLTAGNFQQRRNGFDVRVNW